MFDNNVLLSLPNNVWCLQLVGMQDHDTIMQYVKTHALKDQTRLYQTQKFGGNWYALLLNIDFATRQEALSIVNSLHQKSLLQAHLLNQVLQYNVKYS